MPEELNIIWILAIGFGVSCVFGYLAHCLKLSPILGYLFAGYLIGPNFPGFVANPTISDQLANIGVTLLMFAVGLSFNWKDLIKVKQLALPGAIILSTFSICAGMLYSVLLGESISTGLVIGLAICVSSTVVIVRVLTDQNLLNTFQGHIVVGWTVVEDLISVLGLILLPAIIYQNSTEGSTFLNISFSILIVLLKMAILGAIIYFFGEKLIEKTLKCVARTRSHELFTLAILACVFLIAIGSSYLFGVSLALGAFIAGVTVGKTDVSHQAAANALPMRDAFAVIFFLSIGMLFNPSAVGSNLYLFLGILIILLLLRPLIAFLIIKIAKYPTVIAFTVAIAIGQIGEYSFILAEEGSKLNALSSRAFDVLVACAFISIALNPILFQLFKPFISTKGKKYSLKDETLLSSFYEERESTEPFLPKAIIVGFGPVGQTVARYLIDRKYHVVVIDQNIDTVSSFKKGPIKVLYGDGSQLQILEKADLHHMRLLIITTPDFQISQSIIKTAQQINPYIKIIARVHFKSDLHDFNFGEIPIVCDEEAASEKMITAIKAKLDELN